MPLMYGVTIQQTQDYNKLDMAISQTIGQEI
jgi:hypothetical protein